MMLERQLSSCGFFATLVVIFCNGQFILQFASGVAWRSLASMLLPCLARLLSLNVLIDLRDRMTWRLSDAALLRARVWSGRKHAASDVLASHHGNASGQMLCMSISALADPPHCRSLHGGNLVALCLQNLEHWQTL